MSSRFIIRFDDFCPTMNWIIWEQIESILEKYKVRPIVAIVPDNQDNHLRVAEANPDFWNRVRKWQSQGWTIGLHGWQHCYTTLDAGLVGIKGYSEFAGLPLVIQEKKIRDGLDIFSAQQVRADLWVAPGHSFDQNTLQALRRNGINIVSDGYFLTPVCWQEMIWLPQQLWRFRDMPFGTWTICYHHNTWGQRELIKFENDIKSFQTKIISADEALLEVHPYTLTDYLVSYLWLLAIRAKRFLPS